MQVAVWNDPADVDAALARLGLTSAPLIEAVLAGYLARSSCTENDAPNVAGFVQWGRTLRTLRELLIPLGWSRSDDLRYYTAVAPDERVAIAVASGSEATGLANGTPTTRSAKGPSTAAVVFANAAQGDLFPETLPKAQPKADRDRATWLLMFYVDENEIRAELSQPIIIGEDGFITVWLERIILSAQPLDPIVAVPKPDFGPNLDIPVQRRA
jgi:hypothetical protein